MNLQDLSLHASQALLALLVVFWLVTRQLRIRPIRERMSILPLVLLVLAFQPPGPAEATSAGIGLLVASVALSIGMGFWRAMSTRVWRDELGRTWSQGTPLTAALWVVTVAIRIGLDWTSRWDLCSGWRCAQADSGSNWRSRSACNERSCSIGRTGNPCRSVARHIRRPGHHISAPTTRNCDRTCSMFDSLLTWYRTFLSRRAGSLASGAATVYARAERTEARALDNDRDFHSASRNGVFDRALGPVLGRSFGLIWLVYLIGAYPSLWNEHHPLPTALPAWCALVLFTASYVLLTFAGTPLWATDNPRDQRFNRTMIGIEVVSLVVMVLLLPTWKLEFVFIYPAVLAGIFLARKEGARTIAAITILSILTSLFEEARMSDTAQAALLVGGIGMNTLFWSALMAQNRELRRARAEITRLAVSEERLRIARDLHDLLGHNLSIIALKSELAGRLLASHPNRAAAEIADVQLVARTALQEVREAVAGYRTTSLNEEIVHSTQMLQAAGVLLSSRIAADDLPMDLDRGLAWFVREGTTNIIRHANASSATLRIERYDDRVFAEYLDNGVAANPCHARTASSGAIPDNSFGLIGLGERMRALGGDLSAGPMPERGFRLYVILPLAKGAAPSTERDEAEPSSPEAPSSLELAR
ncbi:MAG: sensor histidine kinase [Thermomicrobiales bacterium]